MANTSPLHNELVRVTGQERLHPALRRLGRACIALARWQRNQQQGPTGPSGQDAPLSTGTGEAPAEQTPVSPDQERRHD